MTKPNSIQSTSDLRAMLIGQIEGVVDGNVDATSAKAICNLSQQIYNTLSIEVKVAAAQAKTNGEKIDAVSF